MIPNAFGEFLTPSVVALDDNDEIIVGKIAKERLVTHPDKTLAQFKRFMGSKHELVLGDRTYKAEELSSFIIRKLVDDAETFLGEKIDEVIVSVPAYFNDAQRYATKLAGQFAGVKIERIINEPSAAALAKKSMSNQEDQSFVVVDFGGGTLDISVVELFDNVVEIVSIAGDNKYCLTVTSQGDPALWDRYAGRIRYTGHWVARNSYNFDYDYDYYRSNQSEHWFEW